MIVRLLEYVSRTRVHVQRQFLPFPSELSVDVFEHYNVSAGAILAKDQRALEIISDSFYPPFPPPKKKNNDFGLDAIADTPREEIIGKKLDT